MCGIAGLITPGRSPDRELLTAMTTQLHHRGPDDAGIWCEGAVALGHRRLSIVDLSSAGHQPLASASGKWVLSYNGEIYNFRELRSRLEGIAWRGHSDSEVILEAIERWGVPEALKRFVGMFAFAAYNRETRELWLARDRLGIKPLFYGWAGADFAFASELSSFKCLPATLQIDTDAVRSYLRYGAVPTPYCIYKGVSKLNPGEYVSFQTDQMAHGYMAPSQKFWSLQDFETVHEIDEADATDQLHELLRTAVRDRLVADVPLGGFLSGGYDSSLVCAIMAEQTPRPIKTFTIGFENPIYNEAEHAKRIAQHLGTDHTELIMSGQDMLDVVQKLPALCDEPFADASILPTYLVSALAREHVTVSLSGDGGDELFWGYARYQLSESLWQRVSRIPAPLRHLGSAVAEHPFTQRVTKNIPAPAWGGRRGKLNQKLLRAADLFGSKTPADLYQRMMSQWINPDLLLAGRDLPDVYNTTDHWTRALGRNRCMAAQDTLGYLPNDILTKVDRASMAVSLEARVPLLDHRVVEFAMRLPDHLKRNGSTTKYLLREVLARYVPRELTDRPKMGFGVPLADWLRGPLQEWAGDLLSESNIHQRGLLNAEPVTQLWQAHLRGDSDNSAKLWFVLMLQMWLEESV